MAIGEHGYIYVICLVELKRWIGVACGGESGGAEAVPQPQTYWLFC